MANIYLKDFKMSKKKLSIHHKNVDLFFQNRLVIKKGLEHIPIHHKIDWGYNHSIATSTYQVYLQSMNIIKDLTIVGLENNTNLFKVARNIIKDWIAYSKHSKNKFLWHEHSVSARLTNIIYFQTQSTRYKLNNKIFFELINEHCIFLNNEENYKNNNHGLIMDKTLIFASQYLKNEKLKRFYMEKALYRVKAAIYRDFSDKGVHLENSPEYHLFVTKLISDIQQLLKENDLSLGKNIEQLLYRASKYPAYIIKPNGVYPNLGDTGTMKNYKKVKFYKDFIDYGAGIVILQNQNKKDFKKSMHLTFKCGYKSITHKHKDDLSLTYYRDGHDILTDSGKYNYNYEDEKRKFIVSPKAHSCIYIEDEDYLFTNPYYDQLFLNITNSYHTNGFKVTTGKNNLYKGSSITRHCIVDERDNLIIIDRVKSNKEKKYIQNFNFHENLDIQQIDNNKYEIAVDNNNYMFETFIQDQNDIKIETIPSFISRNFSTTVQNERIEISKNCKSTIFMTAIYDKSLAEDFKFLKFSNNILYFKNSSITIL